MTLVYSPYLRRYVEVVSPLTVYTFKVTDSQTGIPVNGAGCSVTDQPEAIRSKEGEGGYTDINGVCTVEVLYFNARYYTVGKAGYVTARGTIPGSQINVALDPTTVQYTVAVYAGQGGSVNPTGSFKVPANTKLTVTASPQTGYILDRWLVNNVGMGTVNPLTVTVDRDAITVYAIFKVSEVPPPPPDGAEWPYPIQIHAFDNEKISPGPWTWAEIEENIKGVDTTKLLGARIDYTLTYRKVGDRILVKLFWNDEELEGFWAAPENQGKSSSRSFTVPVTKVRATNTVKVGVNQKTLGFSEVLCDMYVTLGYSEKPTIDPSTGRTWLDEAMEWAKNNSTVLIVGGVAVTGAYVLTRKGAPTFIVQVPQTQYRRREEEG